MLSSRYLLLGVLLLWGSLGIASDIRFVGSTPGDEACESTEQNQGKYVWMSCQKRTRSIFIFDIQQQKARKIDLGLTDSAVVFKNSADYILARNENGNNFKVSRRQLLDDSIVWETELKDFPRLTFGLTPNEEVVVLRGAFQIRAAIQANSGQLNFRLLRSNDAWIRIDQKKAWLLRDLGSRTKLLNIDLTSGLYSFVGYLNTVFRRRPVSLNLLSEAWLFDDQSLVTGVRESPMYRLNEHGGLSLEYVVANNESYWPYQKLDTRAEQFEMPRYRNDNSDLEIIGMQKRHLRTSNQSDEIFPFVIEGKFSNERRQVLRRVFSWPETLYSPDWSTQQSRFVFQCAYEQQPITSPYFSGSSYAMDVFASSSKVYVFRRAEKTLFVAPIPFAHPRCLEKQLD